jgi:plastocyanin
MSRKKLFRRHFLALALSGTAGHNAGFRMLRAAAAPQAGQRVEIEMLRNYSVGRYYFDPIGLYLNPGQTVRWNAQREGFSVTAYHPDNNNRELRIPAGATPFDSGIIFQNDAFDWTFEVEGTYDYCSLRHESIGMVGRIVVGSPGGPGEQPPGYGSREGRAPVYKEAVRAFEWASSEEIVKLQAIPYPLGELKRSFPLY